MTKTKKRLREKLPLLFQTPDSWAIEALKEPLALLSDHAYLERKATTNALLLLNSWPAPEYPKNWVNTLAGIARDEANHLSAVLEILSRRRGKLERLHRNQYASDLHRLVRKGEGRKDIVDRLLVSALIEARSCERFDVLARNCKDAELKRFYTGLRSSEWGHYKIFLELAKKVLPVHDVKKRWQEFLRCEAQTIMLQPGGPRMHSGPPKNSLN